MERLSNKVLRNVISNRKQNVSEEKENLGETKHDRSHGSPFDRGGVDAYYRRGRNPHKIIHTPGKRSKRIENLKKHEIDAYHAGYDEAEEQDFHKVWD